MEYIEIEGERVAVPSEIVSEGRDAVAAFVQAEVAKRNAATNPPILALKESE
jgi:hypothetical protein